MCPPLKFKADSAEFDALMARAQSQGLHIAGDKGSATGKSPLGNVSITWDYDRAAGMLTIDCTGKPFVAPCGTVNDHISAAVGLKPE